jgi:hypothetical protein
MKRVRRVAMIVLAFLLFGAAVNVGVAWACLARADLSAPSKREVKLDKRWPIAVPERWPQATYGLRASGFGWQRDVLTSGLQERREVRGTVLMGSTVASFSLIIVRTGWPLASLQWEEWSESWARRAFNIETGRVQVMHDHGDARWRLGLEYPLATLPALGRWKRIPIMPLWPAFAVNTMLYAAMAAALWYAPGALQRVRRRRRACCLKCGYPRAGLADDAVCPECGRVAKP